MKGLEILVSVLFLVFDLDWIRYSEIMWERLFLVRSRSKFVSFLVLIIWEVILDLVYSLNYKIF